MTTITPTTNSTSPRSVLSSGGGGFGDNPFLVLLTTQLKNQTPLEPVDNASFMQQMASYSSMTQQQDLNANMLKLLDYQGLLARLQGLSEGSALLGKQITYDTDNGHGLTGTVRSVYIDEHGEVRVNLEDGSDIGMRQITAISNAPAPAAGAGGANGNGSGNNNSGSGSGSGSGNGSGSSGSGSGSGNNNSSNNQPPV